MSVEAAPDLPDQALQSALEFAVGIAAAGAKLRPPLAYPAGLKRFLRFHKLPTAALAHVRAVIDADDEFRRKLSSVATTEAIDQVGVLWLTRPEGWERQIGELLPQKSADDAGLRREERRRQAAESAAARARAEVLTLTADLERERAAKTTVVDEAKRLRADLDDVRQRLREAQRAEHGTAQALAKVEAELAETRRSIVEPTSQATATAKAVDASTIRLIEDAVAASGDVARLLAAALGEITPLDNASQNSAPVRSSRKRSPRRQPIRLPGGVLAGSVEAAEFLLRAPGVTTLVDGYNVAKLGWPALDLDHQRERCIMAAENMAKRWKMTITIVFDGADIHGAHTVIHRGVRIVYSPAGVSADDVLRAEMAVADVATPVVVVTNDRAIISDVVAAGGHAVASDVFLALACH